MSSLAKDVTSIAIIKSIFPAVVLLMILGAFCVPASLPGQTSTSQNKTLVVPPDPHLVFLRASVVDKTGTFLPNLPQSAFKIYEDSIEQQLRVFRQDAPVSIGILVDSSASMRAKRTNVAAALTTLVKESNSEDEIFIVNFNDDAYLDQPFTHDIKKLEAALTLNESRGGAAIRDTVSMAIDYTKERARNDTKVLIVVTAGDDTKSDTTLGNLIRKTQQNDILIYSIGLWSEEEAPIAIRPKSALRELAVGSGGLDYYPKNPAEINNIALEVAREIRRQYLLGYLPTNPQQDGTFRRINVIANSDGQPTVRTRNGYYATAKRAPQ